MVVNQEEVVAGIQNPAESRLPAQVPAIDIELNVIGECNPWAELDACFPFDNTGGKAAFGQFNSCPFVFQRDDQTISRADGQTWLKVSASRYIGNRPRYPPCRRHQCRFPATIWLVLSGRA